LKASAQDVVSKENSFFLSLFREIEDKKDKKENLIKIKQEVVFKDSHDSFTLETKKNNFINDLSSEKKRVFAENSPIPLHISKFPVIVIFILKSIIFLGKKFCDFKIEKLEIQY